MSRHHDVRVDTGRIRQYPRGRVWKIRTGHLAGFWAAQLVGADTDAADIAPDQPTALRDVCHLLRRYRWRAADLERHTPASPDIHRATDATQRVLSDTDHAALTDRLNQQGAHRA